MKICHLTCFNGSGMYSVAESLWQAEKAAGLDSHLVDIDRVPASEYDQYADADIFVPHTNLPTEMRKRVTKPLKMVFISHGTPEHIFNLSMAEGKRGYGHSDPLMLWMHWMKTADAVVTFWPRHQAIMQSMCDKATRVHLLPLGIDKAFWAAGSSRGKYTGEPSLLTSENGHSIKRPLDLFTMWPWVYEQVPDACLHVTYLPLDQHRWWFPLLNRNGCSFGAHVSPLRYEQAEFRGVLKSVDCYIGLVQYGDFNRMSLEANAAGCKTISYTGNPFSHFHLSEGDQRVQARQLTAILKGEVEPRAERQEVPDIEETMQGMVGIYERVLDAPAAVMTVVGKVHDSPTNGNRPQRHARTKRKHLAVR
jgi:hypothetical protein